MSDAATSAGVLMDRIYHHQRHFYDFTRKYFLLGRDRLIRGLAPPSGARVLEVGCGTARNLVKAARLYPGANFYGIDISTKMLETARRRIKREGLTASIVVGEADAECFDPLRLFGVPGFSRIFISYSLSMIPGWRNAMTQAFAALEPGGELHIVDFGRQEWLPRWVKAALRRWIGLFHVSPRDDLEAELTRRAAEGGMSADIERPYLGYVQFAVCRRS